MPDLAPADCSDGNSLEWPRVTRSEYLLGERPHSSDGESNDAMGQSGLEGAGQLCPLTTRPVIRDRTHT